MSRVKGVKNLQPTLLLDWGKDDSRANLGLHGAKLRNLRLPF